MYKRQPLGLAIREARERAGLSRNDLGDKVFYGERHIADIENVGSHPSFQLFHDLVTMFNISVDEYFYPAEKVAKSTARRQIETALDLLSDNELKIIQGTDRKSTRLNSSHITRHRMPSSA